MPKTPDTQIPNVLMPLLERVLESDSMGVRFLDEKKFRKDSINQIQKSFFELRSDEKKEVLIFLRECSRSLYIMPAYIPGTLPKVPALELGVLGKIDLPEILTQFSKNELALPAFALSEKTRLDDLFTALHGILSIEYRGPIFFYQAAALEKVDRQMGILNSTPAQVETLNPSDFEQCANTLKSLQWFRNRVLSLSEPWMYAGIFY